MNNRDRAYEADNQEIARILKEISIYLDMQDVAFKPRAFEKAAESISALSEELADLYAQGGVKALEAIPGIGKSIAAIIEELLKTGRSKEHEALKKKTPVELSELSHIEGLGPKKIKTLYQKLKIKNVAELEKAATSGKIAPLAGFGAKSEENIKKGIEFLSHGAGRFLLGTAMLDVRALMERLDNLAGVKKIILAGSMRRKKETIGDGDILIASAKAKPIMDAFVRMPGVVSVIAHGDTKSAVKLRSGLNVDLRVVPEASYGAALNYFTGSKDHNVALRQLAIKKGLKLNEYGLWRGNKQVAGRTEEELYKALGMAYIEPELRENTGELEAAMKGALPKLIGYGDLQGDLQVQTDWTDGSASIEAMALAAQKAGFSYIAITDHTKRLAMTHGLDDARVLKQMAEIARVNKKFHAARSTFRVLSGSECDILKDGSLDLADATLAKLDVVGASVHSYFNLSKKDQTERIMRAMENPHVDIIFHPTGRIVGKRAPYEVDMPALIAHAKKTKTIMEIDSFDRLDLKDEHIRMCVDAGVKMAIDSDAHAPSHYSMLEYGIAQARRGWATRSDIINAWPLEKMLKQIKSSRS